MKRRLSVVLGGLLASSIFVANPTSAEDITKHWAKDYMNYLIEHDIMIGNQNGQYEPEKHVTRAQFATFLARALDLPKVKDSTSFKDIKSDDWYYDVVISASHYGLILGDDKGNFNPNRPINRQEMAVMIKRAMDFKGYDVNVRTHYFKDSPSIQDWAYNDIQSVVSMNIMVGKAGNVFEPFKTATRAEAATVIYRLLNPDLIEDSVPVGQTVYNEVAYNHSFDSVATKQANIPGSSAPKMDGRGEFIASKDLVAYYANPNNFKQGSPEFYQFLKLSEPIIGLDESVLNNYLYDKGILAGSGGFFLEAGAVYEVNAIYLIAHVMHETGKGTSTLARGIEVGLNEEGQPEMVTEENRETLTDIKKTYNMYGIGARDENPNKLGAERAYEEKWFTVRDAIIGGARFVSGDYLNRGQDTLYKMRWNPENPASHQYATHVEWAIIQARQIAKYYEEIGADKMAKSVFEIPRYQNQPTSTPFPIPEKQYGLDSTLSGTVGKTSEAVRIRTYPSTNVSTNIIDMLQKDTELTIHGQNGPWYKVTTTSGQDGWVHTNYITIPETAILLQGTSAFINPLEELLQLENVEVLEEN